jgi:uridine kinase
MIKNHIYYLSNIIQKNNYKIIGITGISGSGKTTFAKLLKNNLKKYYKKVLTISLDDFIIYKNYRNFLSLRWRSQPESHNIIWLLQILNNVKKKILIYFFLVLIKPLMKLV